MRSGRTSVLLRFCERSIAAKASTNRSVNGTSEKGRSVERSLFGYR